MKNRIILLAAIVMMAAAGFTLSPRSIVSANAASTGQQATQEKPLTEEEVSALLEVLKEVVHVRSV
jgi:flagellar basal body-associated protein FliL